MRQHLEELLELTQELILLLKRYSATDNNLMRINRIKADEIKKNLNEIKKNIKK